MTREAVGSPPTEAGQPPGVVEFDLGELRRPADAPPSMPREPLSVRLHAWRTRRTGWWRAVAAAAALGVVAAFVGWHLGGERVRGQVEAQLSANPAVVAWIVDTGPDLASNQSDPREDVELHLLNVGPDPVIIRSITATTDGAPVGVDRDGYVPSRVGQDGTTIASLVLRTNCATEYAQGGLHVALSRFGSDGNEHSTALTVAAEPTLGPSLAQTLNGLCHNPTRDQVDGVDGLQVDQTSGASGATLTVTNTSPGLRQAEITSDESPAFALVSSKIGPQLIRPGETVELRLRVHVLKCTAIVGLQDWASTISLQIGRRGESLEASAGDGVQTSYPLPDLMLVPGGAAIEKTCS